MVTVRVLVESSDSDRMQEVLRDWQTEAPTIHPRAAEEDAVLDYKLPSRDAAEDLMAIAMRNAARCYIL